MIFILVNVIKFAGIFLGSTPTFILLTVLALKFSTCASKYSTGMRRVNLALEQSQVNAHV